MCFCFKESNILYISVLFCLLFFIPIHEEKYCLRDYAVMTVWLTQCFHSCSSLVTTLQWGAEGESGNAVSSTRWLNILWVTWRNIWMGSNALVGRNNLPTHIKANGQFSSEACWTFTEVQLEREFKLMPLILTLLQCSFALTV